MRIKFVPWLYVVALTVASVFPDHSRIAWSDEAQRPNFVFFLVDDLGWADIGCFGSQFHETPNIDRLAESGMTFRQAYAACPVCSPTRASIMTGRHPVRVDITDWIPGAVAKPEDNPRFKHVVDRDSLALEEVTIAEKLKSDAGYATYFLGKWHLGEKGHWPNDQGFDVNVGGHHAGSPPGGYYAPWKNPALEAKRDGEYLTTRLTEEAVSLIERHDADGSSPSGDPFFLMMSYYNVHTPITADRRSIDHYEAKAERMFSGETPSGREGDGFSRLRQDSPEFASMVGAVDRSVGRILEKLDQSGLSENTVVFFFSDNGGLCTKRGKMGPTSNLPLRSGKGWLYEGGIREPMIVRAPGVTTGGTSSEALVSSTDFFPTMLSLAGVPLDPKLHADGNDLTPLFRGEKSESRSLHWHYPHYHGSTWKPGAAIRKGDWKLIEFYETDRVELYDLATDMGEQNDLAARRPRLRDELRQELKAWQKQLRAKMPEPIGSRPGGGQKSGVVPRK
ncbi:MAG: sulfatase [Planctomycetota bacterium]